MIRLLIAGCTVALMLPVAVWFVLVAAQDFAFDRVPFQYQGQLGVLAFSFMILFGLPWVGWLRRRKIHGYLPIAGLAIVMGILPVVVYLLISTAAGPVPSWQGVCRVIVGFGVYGWFCGSGIWILGVLRNPLFVRSVQPPESLRHE